MKQMKSFKKLGNEHILLMVGSLALLFALSRYSNSKMTDGYMAGNYMSNSNKVGEAVDGILGSSPPSQVNLGGMSSPGVFNNENSSDAGALLPNDNNSKWSQLNIQGSGSLENVNLLKAGSLTGINTVGLITQLGLLNPFNRKQESEADYLGMIFSSLSGYDIRETVKIWERMKKLNKGKEPPEFMSTHPSSDNRIKDLNEKMDGVILDYPPLDIS